MAEGKKKATEAYFSSSQACRNDTFSPFYLLIHSADELDWPS